MLVVYIDIIWMLNFIFDSFLLYLTAVILKRKIRYWRLLAGGFIGSMIILLTITPLHSYVVNPFTKCMFSVAMILMVFGYKRFKFFLSNLMMFYLVTFLAGGTLIGIHYFIQFDLNLSSAMFLSNISGFGDPISWLFVLIGFPIVWYFSRKNFDLIETAKIQVNHLIRLDVKINGIIYEFKGLVDSGNQLYDPISKSPVMFISINKKAEEFPEEIRNMASSPEEMIIGNKNISPDWESRIRIIPYKVMGKDHQLIIAIKPEQIVIYEQDETISVNKGLVSFTMQQLSSDDSFECIVHPKMLSNGIRQEKAG